MNLTPDKGFRIGKWLATSIMTIAMASVALAQAVTTTTVQGTVYLASGQPGSGTVQISWPAFTTSADQAIAAGRTTATIGSDGFLSVNLVPNQGSSPAGLFYTVTYYLSDGSTNTEYWVVPAAAQASLAQVRAQVMPAAQAVQTVSKSYVDQAIANISQSSLSPSGGSLTGPLYLAGDPSSSLQAADKHYVDAAFSQAIPVSGATLTGPLAGPSVNASVNSVINVMAPPYNAKGDCATDDHDAIQAALNAAQTNASANSTVLFPAPPGGCYLTSQLNWYGVSLRGDIGVNKVGATGLMVVIKGKPGQDILHTGDPNTTAVTPSRQWSIENLTFTVDDTVDASGQTGSFPHRWPGKWVGDGAMTSGSAVLTSTYAEFSCGDIGQNVLVKGAGVGGADLSTTISSVFPCYNSVAPTTATLATAASTTVSSALVYIALGNMPVTQQIGNCALAEDNSDGNTADWQGATYRLPVYPNLHNVNITSTSGALLGQNNSCGIFWQGAYIPYGVDARNVNITRTEYGIVQGVNDVNPVGSASNNNGIGQDYQMWSHGDWISSYPWISYNGSDGAIKGIQLYANVGPQMLKIKSPVESGGMRWQIEAPEYENGSGTSGWRIELSSMMLINTQLTTSGGSVPAYIEGFDNHCLGCTVGLNLVLGGYNNVIQSNNLPASVTDNGFGNSVTVSTSSNSGAGLAPTQPVAQIVTKGVQPWGRLSADFIRTGNAATPYMNAEDMIFLPADIRWGSGYGAVVMPDATSFTGQYSRNTGNLISLAFSNAYASVLLAASGNLVIGGTAAGSEIPATKSTVYISAKCSGTTSYTFSVRAGSTVVGTASPSCTSSYATTAVTADLSSYAGQNFALAINAGAGEVDWAYIAVRPYQADYNGYQPLNRAGDTMTGPLYLSGDPTASTQAATKNYVDSHSSGAVTVNAFSPVGGYGGSAGAAFVQNKVNYYVFNLPYSITLHTIQYRISTADNTANHYDIGIYSISGSTATLVADIGPTLGTSFAPGTGIAGKPFTTNPTLAPGMYALGITTDCASSCAVMAQGAVGYFSWSYNASGTGSSTAGALPSTFPVSQLANQGGMWGFGVY